MALTVLSSMAVERCNDKMCAKYANEAILLFRSIGHPSGTAFTLNILAELYHKQGDDRRAALAYTNAIELWLGVDERWAIIWSLNGLAALAASHQQQKAAAALIGAIDSRLQLVDATKFQWHRERYDSMVEATLAVLGVVRFAELRAMGEKMTPDAVLAVATAITVNDPVTDLLSSRETEVLRLVANGLTGREIAGAIFLSPRTVNTHVAHILAKLDAPTRRLAVKRARELDLLPFG